MCFCGNEIITKSILNGGQYIWSDSWSPKHKNAAVSHTGMHMGIAYKGKIYCNVHPCGLEENAWFMDFEGIDPMVITRIPF